ncbi:bifunctional DNA primase/polymerase [Kitasatospora sp. NPDC101155]|uniref:bifunctional DNA primase/polymerase n=1 Tax=Kitasatospora sp. NPDC101155 TaxID=3364097 RepID=UPI00382E2698
MHHATPGPLLRAAFKAIERGWHVFPLVPGEKRPAVRAWEPRATTDRRRAARCWTAGRYNVGVATGPSRLVVIDLDVPKHSQDRPPAGTPAGVADGRDALAHLAEQAGKPFPGETHTVRTRRGLHLYFAAPAGVELRNTASVLGWKVDTRACGGYVVGAGSTVDGSRYLVLRDEEPAPLPDWIRELLVPASLPPQVHVTTKLTASDRHRAYLDAAEGRELERVTGARPGQRNRALYLASVALGQLVAGGELSAFEVAERLVSTALAKGLAEREARATVASGFRAGAKRPRTVARRWAA